MATLPCSSLVSNYIPSIKWATLFRESWWSIREGYPCLVHWSSSWLIYWSKKLGGGAVCSCVVCLSILGAVFSWAWSGDSFGSNFHQYLFERAEFFSCFAQWAAPCFVSWLPSEFSYYSKPPFGPRIVFPSSVWVFLDLLLLFHLSVPPVDRVASTVCYSTAGTSPSFGRVWVASPNTCAPPLSLLKASISSSRLTEVVRPPSLWAGPQFFGAPHDFALGAKSVNRG
eukprot:Gb_16244 [translate_table: standard]